MIKNGSNVKLHYTLTVEGDVVDSSSDRDPLPYVHGQGELIDGLEAALLGMAAGDKKTVTVAPEDGYGNHDTAEVFQVPRAKFQDPDAISVGDYISGGSEGQEFKARVMEVGEDEIKLDLNHPLAGKTLHFDVEVVEVG